MHNTVFTIGHSNHTIHTFVALLEQHGINAVCDIRSTPYSRANPQFNRETLKERLRESGIAYVFLGKELGARSEETSCYVGGKVQYDRLARTELFRRGLARVRKGMKTFRIALMCAEKEPLECHRSILVARHLEGEGINVSHILHDGTLESHEDAMRRLLVLRGIPEQDMFRSRTVAIEQAYDTQGDRIAYRREAGSDSPESLRRTVG